MIERTGIVYLITNTIDDKKYVGVTSRTLEARIDGHLRVARKRDTPLYTAIREYNWESFRVEVLERNILLKELGKREKYWIDYYKTEFPEGYNQTSGGWGYSGNITSDLIVQMVEMFSLGYTIEDISFEFDRSTTSVSDILKLAGINREQRLQNNAENRGYKLYSIHPETKKLTKYLSIGTAAEEIGITFCSLAEAIDRGWKSRGFYWKYEWDLSQTDINSGYYTGILIDLMKQKAEMEGTKVLRFDHSGKLDGEYYSFGEAARSVGSKDGPYISRVTKTRKLAYNHYWRVKVSFIEERVEELKKLSNTQRHKMAATLGLDTEDPAEIVKEYIRQKTEK